MCTVTAGVGVNSVFQKHLLIGKNLELALVNTLLILSNFSSAWDKFYIYSLSLIFVKTYRRVFF